MPEFFCKAKVASLNGGELSSGTKWIKTHRGRIKYRYKMDKEVSLIRDTVNANTEKVKKIQKREKNSMQIQKSHNTRLAGRCRGRDCNCCPLPDNI